MGGAAAPTEYFAGVALMLEVGVVLIGLVGFSGAGGGDFGIEAGLSAAGLGSGLSAAAGLDSAAAAGLAAPAAPFLEDKIII